MCLGIPGRVVERFERQGILMGKVDFDGIAREVCLECVPDIEVDDYALVHVGFAISRIDEDEAQQVFRFLEAMDDLDELEPSAANVDPTAGPSNPGHSQHPDLPTGHDKTAQTEPPR